MRILSEPSSTLSARLEELRAFGKKNDVRVAVTIAPTDGAYAQVVRWACSDSLSAQAVPIIEATAQARNRKVAKLDAAASYAEAAGFSHVLFLDADIMTGSVVFDALQDAFRGSDVGAACQASGSVPTRTGMVARLEAAVVNGSQQALPLLLRLNPQLLAGAVLALRMDALRAVGGWAQFGHLLGEDLALSRALENSAWQVVSLPTPAMALRSCPRLALLWERMVRWLGVIREQRPLILLAYPLMFFYAAPLCALWIAAHKGGTPFAVSAAGGVCVLYSRMLIGREARRATTGRAAWPQVICDLILSDLFLSAIWVRILWAPPKRWSGHQV